MRVTVAIDSFKGSLSTFESGGAVAEGIRRVYSDAEVDICPLADGGEGTVEAIISACEGELVSVPVHDPLGRIINAKYGLIKQSGIAIIEMSAAAGITLLTSEERDPMAATTYGVGELIADAIGRGCRRFIVGIGGSATNDGGVGMLTALGFEFLDEKGAPILLGARGLKDLATIKKDKAFSELMDCDFSVACDVKNPLCGASGCSAVYGKQKGATPEMIEKMDVWLGKYAELTKKINPDANEEFEGAGAAGGMGYAFLSYLGGRLESGIELVMSATGLEEHIKNADIVVTGEGRLDGQSCMGKAPVGVARTAKKYGKPVIAFSGCVTDDARECNSHGIDAFFPIVRTPCTLEEAMNIENSKKNLADTAEQVFRIIDKIC